MKILFICTGNLCRSPMAEMLLRHKLKEKNIDNIEVCSAGLNTYNGALISRDSKMVLINKGIDVDLSFRSKEISVDLLRTSDMILTMTLAHKLEIHRNYPKYIEKVFTISEYANNGEMEDVIDPYGCSRKTYEDVFFQIDRDIEKIIKKFGH